MSDIVSRLSGSTSPSEVIKELGYGCTTSKDYFKSVVGLMPAMDDGELCRVITMLASTRVSIDPDATLVTLVAFAAAVGLETPSQGAKTWDYHAAADALREACPSASWPAVMRHLDQTGSGLENCADPNVADTVLRMFARLTNEPFPVQTVASGAQWNSYPEAQLVFLKHAIEAQSELFPWQNSLVVMPSVEGLVGGASPAGTPNQAWLSVDLYLTLDAIARGGEVEPAKVADAFQNAVTECPEIAILGAAFSMAHDQSGVSSNGVLADFITQIGLPPFLSSQGQAQTNAAAVLHRVWASGNAGQTCVARAMAVTHEREGGASVPRMLDVCQDLKALSPALARAPHALAVELAALAARREYLNLEMWLQERAAASGAPFAAACLRFLRARATGDEAGVTPGAPKLAVETMAIFFKVLHAGAGGLPPDLRQELQGVAAAAARAHPTLAAVSLSAATGAPGAVTPGGGGGGASGTDATGVGGNFPSDVEAEANSNFQRLYSGQRTVERTVEMLRTFRASQSARERDVFACMVHNLFDEYRFFPKYPEKELRVTAVLFGRLIDHQLVASVTLGVALRCVLDAVRKPFGTKMFAFGSEALEQFKQRLQEWPQYCQHLAAVPHLPQAHPDLAQLLREAADLRGAARLGRDEPSLANGAETAVVAGVANMTLSGGDESLGAQAPGAPPTPVPRPPAPPGEPPVGGGLLHAQSMPVMKPAGGTSLLAGQAGILGSGAGGGTNLGPAAPAAGGSSGFATSLNLETLLAAGTNQNISVPDADTVDKVHFVVNNLSTQNMTEKAAEVKARISKDQYGWFAVYLVVKRASIEPNFHALYSLLLDAIGDEDLFRGVLDATYANIKALLSSNKVKTNSGERSLLKNLGSWLGNLTISRNQPVLMIDLDVKSLVLEAYQTGHMIAVIPFVAKVLEPALNSIIFKPPNPWTGAVLGLLKEIYNERDLKLNLKFEMERLFKHLEVPIKDQAPSFLLHQRQRDRVNNPDFAADKNAPNQAGMVGAQSLGSMPTIGTPYEPTGAMGSPLPNRGNEFQQQNLPQTDGDAGGLQQHIKIAPAPNLPETTRVALARLLPVALTAGVREIVSPVVERSITIACMTARELVLKDFAVEPDATRLRKAAHLMVSSLAGSLALVTCREPLKASVASQLRALLQQAGAVPPPGNDAAAQALELAVQSAVADNLELGCSLIEQAATERATREIDEQLAPAAAARRDHREKHGPNGQPFFDPNYLQGRFPGALPESLRPRPGHLAPNPQRIYDDFANVPRAPPPPPGAPPAGAYGAQRAFGAPPPGAYPGQPPPPPGAPQPPPPPGAPEHAGLDAMASAELSAADRTRVAFARLDAACVSDPAANFVLLPESHEARAAVAEIVAAAIAADAVVASAREVFQRSYEPPLSVETGQRLNAHTVTSRRLRRTAHAAALAALCRRSRAAASEVSVWVTSASDDRALDKAWIESLVRAGVFSEASGGLSALDDHLSQIIADTSNAARAALATACGAYLAQHCVLVEPCVAHEELRATLDALAAAAPRDSSPVGLARLVERARAAGEKKDPSNASLSSPGQNAGRDASTDPPGLRETVAKLFDEWARVADLPAGDAAIETFLVGLANSELLQNDEQQERFLRILVELAVTHCLGSESAKGGAGAGAGAKAPDGTSLPPLSFVAVDAFTRLVSSLCRRGEDKPLDTRLVLLSRALVAVARTATRDVDERGAAFNPRPYHRALVGLMSEMHAPDTALDASHPHVLSAFAGALLAMRPNRIPGFAFAWLELVSHRCFLPRLLLDHDRQGWPLLRRLLVAALTFLEPFLRQSALTETVRLLYRGTLRLLLVLLHDFPEFLCDHHFDLCDVIPPNCIQMRNLVLSAFPRNMRLPDPFTPNLKVDLLPEISLLPRVISGAECALQLRAPKLRNELDTFLDSRTPSIDVFVENLRERVTLDPRTAAARGASYDAPLVNAVVLRCGARGVAAAAAARKGDPKAGGKNPMSNTAPMEVFQKLATDLDPEGRYVFLNAIANQLRFPNSHTHYFSCVLLYLFAECNSEAVREQITRVLLERLIVNRPHPWGLLITFIELIKNPRYAFWDRAFTRCAPDIERLFESVARSCIAPTKPEEDGTVV